MKRLVLTPEQEAAVARDYFVQSETVRGEPRWHFAQTYAAKDVQWGTPPPVWGGPMRRSPGIAWNDARWHAAGRWAERAASLP